MKIKDFTGEIRDALKSRVFVALALALALELVVFVVLITLNIHAGTSIQVRCDITGGNPVCASSAVPWTYLFNFISFAVVAFLINIFAALKLLAAKGRTSALSYLWISLVVSVVTSTVILAIFHTLEA